MEKTTEGSQQQTPWAILAGAEIVNRWLTLSLELGSKLGIFRKKTETIRWNPPFDQQRRRSERGTKNASREASILGSAHREGPCMHWAYRAHGPSSGGKIRHLWPLDLGGRPYHRTVPPWQAVFLDHGPLIDEKFNSGVGGSLIFYEFVFNASFSKLNIGQKIGNFRDLFLF